MSKKPIQPATVEHEPAHGGLDLEVKRFYVPGYKVRSTCPKCGGACVFDCGENYFSYPPIGKPFTETLYCNATLEDGGMCEHEFDVELRLDITLSATSPIGGDS